MDPLLLWAIRVLFILAATAPLALVVRYRWKDVRGRRDSIIGALEAFKKTDDGKRALAANPYISHPDRTFDHYHSPGRYALPLVVLTILMASSSYIAYRWTLHQLDPAPPAPATQSDSASVRADSGSTPSSPQGQPTAQPSAAEAPARTGFPERMPLVVIMALAGGMVWTIQQVMTRIYDGELGPPDLQEIMVGLLAAVPIGYAFSLVTEDLNQLRAFMAFAAAAFPVRETARMIRQFATRRMLGSTEAAARRPTERHLGSAIDGVSDEALARLAELRIVTALDIAYSDPVKIMVQTGFALPVIIDWMDQAIWALYIGDKKSELNRLGIRCSLDVAEFVDMRLRDDQGKRIESPDELSPGDKAALDAVAAKMGENSRLVMDLFFRISNDPQVVVLRHLWYQGGVPHELRT